ncbi:efflux RND transporter permease subunit [Puteibacter caeruleilacunae]|nr:efflux RND transporter permease subunit [Puteibacter caeruleilacunae]
MKITKFAVDRPVTTTMLFLGIVFFGLMAYFKLGVNQMPDVSLPIITVTTTYPGATPEEIEKEVTDKIEKEVASLNGLKELKSNSMNNVSIITAEFYMNVKSEVALRKVRNKVDMVLPELPKESKKPLVEVMDPSSEPVITLCVTGDIPGYQLFDYVDKKIKDQLSRIDGVAKIDIKGAEKREIKVLANMSDMYDNQMNLTDLANSIEASNRKVSSGSFVNVNNDYALETGKQYAHVDSIRKICVATPGGVNKLTDFSEVVDSIKKREFISGFWNVEKGEKFNNILKVGVIKVKSANAVKIAGEVKSILPEIKESLPEGIEITIANDPSDFVESAVDDALMNVILGILITAFVLYFFLSDIRSVIVVSISIPVSLITTFMAIDSFGGSLNMMTLMSYAVAIGALISNSIVVIDNILRLRNGGMPIKEAAVKGTEEVMMAVIASTGTNLVVFLPIASMTSMVGAYFTEYALTISAATAISLVVSFMLTPMLSSLLFKKAAKESAFSGLIKRFFGWLERGYEKSLERLISNKLKPILLFSGTIVVLYFSSFLLSYIGFEFIPKEDNGDVYVELEMPTGMSLDKTAVMLDLIEKKIAAHSEVKTILSTIGEKNSSTRGTNLAKMHVKLNSKEAREITNEEMAEVLYKELNVMPDIRPVVTTTKSDESQPLMFRLQSTNKEELREANDIVLGKVKNLGCILNAESNYRKGNALIQVKPKEYMVAETGLTPFMIAMNIRAAINGVKASVMKVKGREYDIRVSYPQNQVNTLNKIKQIPIFTTHGCYTIAQLATIGFGDSQSKVQHIDKINTIEITATQMPGIDQGMASEKISEILDNTELPESVNYVWAGDIKMMNETMTDMAITFAIAVLLMYMLLASLLENFWHPIIIFTTVPMAMIGVFVLMYLAGTSINIMTLMAVITLLGLVVNDSILIHDYTQQLKEKFKLKKAVLTACRTKMKTVIMTTVAIIAGMIPNAVLTGSAGAEFRTPMAVVTIGGMITSTILTLYIIPSLFYLIQNKKKK